MVSSCGSNNAVAVGQQQQREPQQVQQQRLE
jgi:hypothetical protein